MHSRMRGKVDGFSKVLMRAKVGLKAGEERKMTTITGKTFKRG